MTERRIRTPKDTFTSEREISKFLKDALQYNPKAKELVFRLHPIASAFVPVSGIVGRLEVKNTAGVWELRKEIVRSPDVTVLDSDVETPTQAYYFQLQQARPSILISLDSDPWCRILQVEISQEADPNFRDRKERIVKNLFTEMQKKLENHFRKRS
ncbi:hypothetical protein KBD71_05570 [Candidatus Woesebacteria bacterium]|nr:hypothetical protein [Candidatus Woesebacteria bacterium]